MFIFLPSRQPRLHETGGKYGNGVIVRRYRTGSVIPVRVELTANHHGYFEFRTCAMAYRDQEITQECLDQYLLHTKNGSVRYYPGPGNRIFEGYYKLPEGLTCVQCVFQWRYVAGNNWGDCGNGTGTQHLSSYIACRHGTHNVVTIKFRGGSLRLTVLDNL